jgi:cell fate regulator YaaT (PSP1 superfamily)
MPIVVGISLRIAGKIFSFSPGTTRYRRSERVVVETSRGTELGTVRLEAYEVPEDELAAPLKPILRVATVEDFQRFTLNQEREARTLEICKRLVTKLTLPMQLIDAQFTLDGGHVLIHFLADNRVDFRELVRELARELHTRIELRQVGVRDEAKLVGGYGICGRRLCCAAFLTNFGPVAISMAKVQGLALNPQKISGMCGRLMCCLAYEQDHYREALVGMPKLNAQVLTPRGRGKVTKLNVIARQVEVALPDIPSPIWFSIDELDGAQPATAPCGAEYPCGGNCAHAHAPEDELAAMVHLRDGQQGDGGGRVDVASEPPTAREPVGATTAATAVLPIADDTPGGQRKNRRRRKRTPAQELAPTGSAASPVPQPKHPREIGEAPSVAKRRRRRRSGGTNETSPTPPPAPPGKPALPAPPPAARRPSGRYRPRRENSGGTSE